MIEFNPSNDLMFMVVYDAVEDISIGYLASELRPGVFPGDLGTELYKSKTIIDAIDGDFNQGTIANKVLGTCRDIFDRVRGEFNRTFVILIGKRFDNFSVILEFSAFEVLEIHGILFSAAGIDYSYKMEH